LRWDDSPKTAAGGARLALALLTVVYALNFLDRQILGILLPLIKREFRFDDAQLGLLGGLPFALFYATLAIPIAALADRRSRVAILTVSLGLWSLMTAACGFARGFSGLFAARVGVGVGEAGGVAPSYSLIADLFPPAARARALAVFSMGVPVGAAAGVFLGGEIGAAYGWRAAFWIVGGVGLAITPLLPSLLRDPPRGRFDAGRGQAVRFGAVLRHLARRPGFWLLALGASANSMMGYGLILWIPSLLVRSFGMTLPEAGRFYSALGLIGGVIGIWAGGVLGDRLGARRPEWLGRIPALAALAAIPCYLAALSFAGDRAVTFVLFLVPGALALVWLGPILSAIQAMCPAPMRATGNALFLLLNNLLGIALGTWALGALSKWLTAAHGTDSLRLAILYALPLYLVAALFMWAGGARLRRDMA
jgi:predicted MFS family arabinose efflux permease